MKDFRPATERARRDALPFLKTLLVMLLVLCPAPWPRLAAQDAKENAEFKLAVGLYTDGMYDLAAEQLKNFIAAYPSTSQGIEARYYLGETQMKLKRYDEARVTFQNFALTYTDHPKAPDAWMRVGDAYAATGNSAEAASAYERVKVFHPKSPVVPEALNRAASQYLRIGDRERARKLLLSVLADYPTDKRAGRTRLTLAGVYADDGEFDAALREAQRASDEEGSPELASEALLTLGRLQADAGLADAARATLNRLAGGAKKSPAASPASYLMGRLDLATNSYPAAIEHFSAAAADTATGDSVRAASYVGIGQAYRGLHKYAEARASFERAAGVSPPGAAADEARLQAALAARDEGNAAAALASLRPLADSARGAVREQALYEAFHLARSSGRMIDAAQFAERFAAADPAGARVPEVLFTLGNAYQVDQHDPRKAIGIYERIRQQFPNSPYAPQAMMAASACFEQLGDIRGALSTLTALEGQYPANDSAESVRRRIGMLEDYRLKDHDAAVEHLAGITAGIAAQDSKAAVAFQLGSMYFHDLKEYAAAAAQFTAAIDNGLDAKHFVDAYYYRARAYDLLSAFDSSALGQAKMYYEAFLKQYPTGTWSEEVSYRLALLSQRSGAGEAAVNGFIAAYPNSAHCPELLLGLGNRYDDAGRYADAAAAYRRIVLQFPGAAQRAAASCALGNAYRELRQNDSAAVWWKEAASGQPGTHAAVEALWSLAEAASRSKQFDEALGYARRILQEYEYTSAASAAAAALPAMYLDAGMPDEAIALLRNEAAGGQEASALYALGRAYELRGDPKTASGYYRRSLALHFLGNDAAQALYALGGIARGRGQARLASLYFRQAAALGVSGTATAEVAGLLFDTEQYADAAKQYRELAEKADSAGQKQYDLSRMIVSLLRSENLAEAQPAIAAFEKSYAGDNTAIGEIAYERALYYFRRQDYATARKLFELVADDYEDTRFGPYGDYYLGKILEVTNKLDEAAKKYTDILKKFPSSDILPRVSLSLGNMHFNAERYEDAIRHYQHILADSQKAGDVLPYAMSNLIEAYQATKLYDDAIRVTRSYIERYPNDENIIDKKIKLGTLFTQAGYYDQAVLQFQSIMSEAGGGTEAELHYDIGEAYYYKGDYQQAILEFLKVPYLVSRQGKVNWTATSLYMAGQSYEKMSKFEEAIGMYQQIIERPGIDATFKAGARKEIDRVRTLLRKGPQ